MKRKTDFSIRPFLLFFILLFCFSTACNFLSLPTNTLTPTSTSTSTSASTLTSVPTPNSPPKSDSSLASKLVGEWSISGSAPWGDTTIIFFDDGKMEVIGLEDSTLTGTYFFTSENTITYSLPTEQGTIELDFTSDTRINLIITKSDDAFGLIASATRIK